MERYIDADKFISWLDIGHLRSPSEICYSEGDVKIMIDMQPTVDVAKVVRCKDCKYCEESDITNRIFCTYQDTEFETYPNDFCSHGEQKIK